MTEEVPLALKWRIDVGRMVGDWKTHTPTAILVTPYELE